MKNVLMVTTAMVTPILLWAQTDSIADSFVGILAPKLSLYSAIIIAIVTTIMVFTNARAMKGGIFGVALNYFATGMVFILIGFIVVAFNIFNTGGFTEIANNILFILGYITMALAAHKLSQIAGGK